MNKYIVSEIIRTKNEEYGNVAYIYVKPYYGEDFFNKIKSIVAKETILIFPESYAYDITIGETFFFDKSAFLTTKENNVFLSRRFYDNNDQKKSPNTVISMAVNDYCESTTKTHIVSYKEEIKQCFSNIMKQEQVVVNMEIQLGVSVRPLYKSLDNLKMMMVYAWEKYEYGTYKDFFHGKELETKFLDFKNYPHDTIVRESAKFMKLPGVRTIFDDDIETLEKMEDIIQSLMDIDNEKGKTCLKNKPESYSVDESVYTKSIESYVFPIEKVDKVSRIELDSNRYFWGMTDSEGEALGYCLYIDEENKSLALVVADSNDIEIILEEETDFLFSKCWRLQTEEFYHNNFFVGDIVSKAAHQEDNSYSTSRYGAVIMPHGMYIGEFPAGHKMKVVIGKFFDINGNVYEGTFKLPIKENPNWNDPVGENFPF
ncbi:MAG: hypothetical protein KBT22_07555 [Bacteroidales bacterium]|nr:hypothetical protein [Candidatus Scybalocola fimicaballi]